MRSDDKVTGTGISIVECTHTDCKYVGAEKCLLIAHTRQYGYEINCCPFSGDPIKTTEKTIIYYDGFDHSHHDIVAILDMLRNTRYDDNSKTQSIRDWKVPMDKDGKLIGASDIEKPLKSNSVTTKTVCTDCKVSALNMVVMDSKASVGDDHNMTIRYKLRCPKCKKEYEYTEEYAYRDSVVITNDITENN